MNTTDTLMKLNGRRTLTNWRQFNEHDSKFNENEVTLMKRTNTLMKNRYFNETIMKKEQFNETGASLMKTIHAVPAWKNGPDSNLGRCCVLDDI